MYSVFADFITDYYIVLFWSTPPNTPWPPNTKFVPTPLSSVACSVRISLGTRPSHECEVLVPKLSQNVKHVHKTQIEKNCACNHA